MRIAFLTTEFVTEASFFGGLANYLFRTGLALKNLGHDPVVFVLSNKEQTFLHRGIEVHRIRMNSPLYVRILDRLTFMRFARPLTMIAAAMNANVPHSASSTGRQFIRDNPF